MSANGRWDLIRRLKVNLHLEGGNVRICTGFRLLNVGFSVEFCTDSNDAWNFVKVGV